MPRLKAANNAKTTLSQDINATATSFNVADGTLFPDAPFLASVDDEIMEIGAKSANTFSAVLRGREGTAPLAHSNGAIVENRFTAGAYDELETSAGAQTKANTAEQNAKSYVDGKVKTDVPTGAKFTDTVTTVNNTLASTSTTEALSAAQGKKLNDALTSHLSDYASLQFGSIPYTTTRHVTYYIDEVNGDDDNDGLTPGTAFKTWAKTESMIPLICFHRVTIRIIDNLNETISISNRFCKSLNRITVRGDTTTPGDHQINGIRAYTGMGIRFQYLRINGPVILRDGVNSDIRNCEPRNPGGNGIEAHHGIYYIAANDFGNDVVKNVIYAVNSRVFSANNIGNATRYGLIATVASTIGKDGTQPTGTVANERVTTGGVIR